MLPLYLEMSEGQLLESEEQLKNLESCKNRPHVLDDEIVDCILRLHSDQNGAPKSRPANNYLKLKG